MRDLTSRALDTAISLCATYADVRVVRRLEESITIKSTRVEGVADLDVAGRGVPGRRPREPFRGVYDQRLRHPRPVSTCGGRLELTLLLLGLGLLGCEPALVVNERFVPTTVGIVTGTDRFEADGVDTRRYFLADGPVIEVAVADLDPFTSVVPEGDLLLMGEEPSPWIIRAVGRGDGAPGCFHVGSTGRALDRGATIEIEMDSVPVVSAASEPRDRGSALAR